METYEKRKEYLDKFGLPDPNLNLTYWIPRSREELETMIDMADILDGIDRVESVIKDKGIYIDSNKSIVITLIENNMYCVITNTEIMNLMMYGWN